MTKILIVDDNEEALYMLRFLLQKNGYQVDTATNGQEALEKARAERPDMIISDILMPVMDGFTLCRQWKGDDRLKEIPFVFYTATYTDPQDEELTLSLGAERFIVKPVEPDVFLGMLREVIEECKASGLVTPRQPVEEEAVLFKEYSEALIRKLEDKMVQVEEANQCLLALQEASAAMTSSLGLDEVLRRIGRGAVEALGSSAVWILVVNEAEDTLESKVMVSVSEEDVSALEGALALKADAVRIPIVVGRNWLTDAVLSGEPIFVPDVSEMRQRARCLEVLIPLEKITTFKSLAVVPLLVKDRRVGVVALARSLAGEDSEAEIGLITAFANQAAIAIENARLFSSVSEQREQLRALAAWLANVEEAERQRLAQELHDRAGQNLTALSINLNVVRSQLSAQSATKMAARLDDSLRLVTETAEHIRDVMADLRPPVLDDYGLLAALRWYGERFSQRTAVATVVQGEELAPRLPPAVEMALFCIAQEALTNVAKHAQARQVTMMLEGMAGGVRLTIADDGDGFDPTAPRRPGERPGWGLITMRERAQAVDGHLQVESAPGQGTRVVVEVGR